MDRGEDLRRIESALALAGELLQPFASKEFMIERKANGDPVTEADHLVNDALAAVLPRAGEGWLSEETADDASRLDRSRVWIVDPLDGTREFVMGLPEWCVSVGLVEDGVPVAGGVCCPVTDHLMVGSIEDGVRLNGKPVRPSGRSDLAGALVLASRSEVDRGEWARFENAGFEIRPMGSVAYKMGLVAAGLADATWTLVPKNEWDVAAGTALVRAAGGRVWTPGGGAPGFNRADTLLPGLIAAPAGLAGPVEQFLQPWTASEKAEMR